MLRGWSSLPGKCSVRAQRNCLAQTPPSQVTGLFKSCFLPSLLSTPLRLNVIYFPGFEYCFQTKDWNLSLRRHRPTLYFARLKGCRKRVEHYSFYLNTIIRTSNYLGTGMEEQKGWVEYSLHFPSSWFKDRAAHRGEKASIGTFVETPQTTPTQCFLLSKGDWRRSSSTLVIPERMRMRSEKGYTGESCLEKPVSKGWEGIKVSMD